ncbi:unnamed protein product [Adineta steineri]|uniref:Medium-chain acyl-CoA ligase ACSF2, mitochondrial n=1 Tax=Adineta steineri TaxID=433720 RepID=A0A814BA37_9BILA|nr:unnamed protein product [Adineta steineri]CAF0990772.1 unnamed protein product [Adineta steineri]
MIRNEGEDKSENTKVCVVEKMTSSIKNQIEKQDHFTMIPKINLTSSYFHHSSSFQLINKTLSQHFDEMALKYSNEECFIFKGEQKRYTYKTFKDEVDNIAASLLDLGFEKNDRFAVWLPNTSENVTISYAASKLGLIKVNINPAYVERELEYCINKVGCKGILLSPSVKSIDLLSIFLRLVPELSQRSLAAGQLSAKSVPTLKYVILTGEQTSLPGTYSYVNLLKRGAQLCHNKLIERQASVDPDSALAIFFTSGTTGQPKAATLTNFGILNLVRAQWELLNPFYHRVCVPIPMFHIFAEISGVLNVAVGKCKVIFPAILPDTLATMRAIHEEKCTALIGAPIIFRDILNHPDKNKYDLSSLAYGGTGATTLTLDFLYQIEKEFPITRMVQGYGLTENASLLTSGMWAGDNDPQRRLGSLGRCMQGLEVKVVDRQGQIVPIGQQGEIWARGYSIMRGYFADPDKTAETLTPSGWLRTGDEGKMDDDGFLYFIGRQKEIIIRGGVNIYPIEIENTICEHPSVAQAQVFSIPDQRYGEELCVWIILKSNISHCQSEDIQKFLQNKLAFFKIPKYIRFVDKFITTPTGKVQKFKMSQIMATELKQTISKL